MGSSAEQVREVAVKAKAAAAELAPMTRASKDAVLQAMADALVERADEILAANIVDLENGTAAGLSASLLDRLRLSRERVEQMAGGLRDVAALPDPVGEVIRGYTLPNGLEVRQVRVPMGVIGIVYEARPNVTVDAAGLCLKSANAVLLRGSASAYRSNTVLVEVLAAAAEKAGAPTDSIQLVPGTDRESVTHLLHARGLVDLVIPRGGASLIAHVVETATVPVIETGVGNCHIYVDAAADLEMAERIVMNAKVQRPSVCNAAETLLVHREVAAEFLPRVTASLADAGVRIHGDEMTASIVDGPVLPVTDDDWAKEYIDLDLAVGVVDSVDEAIAHIRRWTSGHTEAIISTDARAIRRFVSRMDSAAVMVNASTRFTDGGELGFGAEIGISTQKLHARGPMGLPEMTSTTFVITGDGQTR
ncbi:glutamate-5-semialdehyde dehydrogenase [Fodinicola feengrottensis]|uniref:Gamma-glutamyl phosphate reductase n=1 Tax=Fodinicola feengrottensis TaxID=435914 RepID=A0ABP4VAQ6_9ACTN|nr:glutamate-5-semialdehyde dehydrogenase [Fodinicola feengrottensis]